MAQSAFVLDSTAPNHSSGEAAAAKSPVAAAAETSSSSSSRTVSAANDDTAANSTEHAHQTHAEPETEKSHPPPCPDPDPNVVDWDGPADPANPRNWPKARKMTNIGLVSLSVLYTNLATTLFAPGADLMRADFGFTSWTLQVMTITIQLLGSAGGQLFVAPLSEVFGRLPIYQASSVLYLGFTAGCSRSTSVAELLVFRMLTGFAASSYMSTGAGTVADLLVKEQRGAAMAFFTAGPLFGPVVGPIVGGFVSQNLGWRWAFYLMLMFAGAVTIVSFLFMRETSAPILLQAKAARLRKETGNPNLRAAGDRQTPMRQLVLRALTRPVKFLVRSPVVLLIALYISFNFGVSMLLLSTFPTVYERTYHWSVGVSGLAYIGIGVGCALGIVLTAKLSDRLLKAEGGGGGGKPYRAERRLILMMFVTPLLPAGLFIYGWTAEYQVQWVAPIIGTAVAAAGVIVINAAAQTYLIDVFGPLAAASAIAAMTLLRNLTGAFLPLAGPSLYDDLGMGWGNSVLAFVAIAFIPVPFFFYHRGQWLREKFPVEI